MAGLRSSEAVVEAQSLAGVLLEAVQVLAGPDGVGDEASRGLCPSLCDGCRKQKTGTLMRKSIFLPVVYRRISSILRSSLALNSFLMSRMMR